MQNFRDLRGPIIETGAKNQKGKADCFANFTLRLVFQKNNQYNYYDHFSNSYKRVQSVPRYSKRIDEQEGTPRQSIAKLLQNSLMAHQTELAKAELYFNLNRGYRINFFAKENRHELVENIMLHRFTQLDIKNLDLHRPGLPDWVFELPTYDAQNPLQSILNEYCEGLQNCALKISIEQTRTIWRFFNQNFISK